MDKTLLSTILETADPMTARALIEGYDVLSEGRLGRMLGTAALGLGIATGTAPAETPEEAGMPRDYEDIEMDADDGIECGLDGCWVDDEEGHHRVESVYDDLIRERRGIAGMPTRFDDEAPAEKTDGEPAVLDEGIGKTLGGTALAAGLMFGGANAAPKGDPMACLANPQYAKNHTELCNSLKPSPKKAARADAKKTAKQAPGKTIKGKHGTVKVANMKNVWRSDAFQDHVQELYDSMIRANPAADSQMTYEKAGQQALQDVATGKLRL